MQTAMTTLMLLAGIVSLSGIVDVDNQLCFAGPVVIGASGSSSGTAVSLLVSFSKVFALSAPRR